jgi:hypothetical protein
VLEEEIVHLPERSLRRRGLGSLGRKRGMRVDVGEREVPPDVADIAGIAEQLPDHRLRPPAEGTLEISLLDERDRCGSRASKMIALRFDGHGEVHDRLRRAEQGSSAHRTRQQGGPAEDEPRQERPAKR